MNALLKCFLRIYSFMRFAPVSSTMGNRRLLFVGIAACLALQLGFLAYIEHGRPIPYGTDDAYTYIVKTPQMFDGCFLQNCPALNSLRTQFSQPQESEEQAWQTYRMQGRAFLVYHPLYTLMSGGLTGLGLSLEASYELMMAFGTVIITLAFGFLLYVIWGAKPAGLTIGVLGITLFQGQGLHLVVPSNMTLAVAVLIWASILMWRNRAIFILCLGIPIMLTLHPAGLVYSAISLSLMVLCHDGWPKIRSVFAYLFALSCMLIYLILPHFVTAPDLAAAPEPETSRLFWLGLAHNFEKAFAIIIAWDKREAWGGLLISLPIFLLATYGLAKSFTSTKGNALKLIGVLAICSVLSLFLVLPRYPAEFFSRIWCSLAILILGGAISGLLNIIEISKKLAPPPRIGLQFILLVFCTIYICGAGLNYVKTAVFLNKLDPFDYSFAQADIVRKNCSTVLYTSETPLLAFLSHGLLECPAIYLPALGNDSSKTAWLTELPRPYYIIAMKPGRSGLDLTRGGYVDIVWHETTPPPVFEVRFEGQVPQLLKINGTDYPVSAQSWTSLPPTLLQTGQPLRIRFDYSHRPVKITGIRLKTDQQDLWPWWQDIEVTHTNLGINKYVFSAQRMSRGLVKKAYIVDSEGATLLAKQAD